MAEKKPAVLDLVEVVRHGEKLILPEDMSYASAIEALQREQMLDEEEVLVCKEFTCIPFDGNLALQRVLERRFGKIPSESSPGLFFDIPPRFESVSIGPNKTAKVVWGKLRIPSLNEIIELSAKYSPVRSKFVFIVSSKVKRKHEAALLALLDEVNEELRLRSVFKGQAALIAFTDSDNDLLPLPFVKFIDTADTRPADLVFSEDLHNAIAANIYTPIIHHQALRLSGVPLKRGILLAGPYGTGKTMIAKVAAYHAVQSGAMFLYLMNLHDLPNAIRFAQDYGRTVIFAEDVDFAAGGDRDEQMNSLLNTLDGIDTKSGEVMVVLTTNNIERIHPSLLRPGRMDVALHVGPPDAPTVRRLIRTYARDLLSPDVSLELVGEILDGEIPAVVREVVERAKLMTISRTGQPVEAGSINDRDLEDAANLLVKQRKFVNNDEAKNSNGRVAVLQELASALKGETY
jgi:transitional endoplasmic reticulum ATPase